MQGMLTNLTLAANGLITYSYVCLPVFLTVITGLRKKSHQRISVIPANDCPKIAVVVSAYDEADTISHLL